MELARNNIISTFTCRLDCVLAANLLSTMATSFARIVWRVAQSGRRLSAAFYSRSNGSRSYSTSTAIAFTSVSLAAIASCSERDENGFNARNGPFLSRNFVADAASIASPSVVNIICPMGGILGEVAAGSGFIISKVHYMLILILLCFRMVLL